MMISAIEEIIYYIEGNIIPMSDDEKINLKNFLEDNFAITKKDLSGKVKIRRKQGFSNKTKVI
ncbi:unnamed protein product [marine sediment metagenome]|uniref:Uncharacterized protein n=1 Tax=marine sediment metagenome TaxID=412755 RepID=X1UVG4_9ZZZZ